MLHEEVIKYRELSGDTNPNTPISRIGGYLDGYEKALDQEPCDDANANQHNSNALNDVGQRTNALEGDVISRQAAIRIAEQGQVQGYEWQFKELNKLPPVTPQPKTGHWIPISERLPKDKTYVLTTIKVPNRIAHARSGWYEGGFFHNDNGDVWKATDMEVIAWMPLPTAYEPQEPRENEG